ncbi:MAG: type II secretion system protein GspD [Planctomycetota bacterium]
MQVTRRSHKSLSKPLLGLLLALGCAAPLPAQPNSDEGSGVSSALPRRTDTLDYITIDVREKDLKEVLSDIGRQVDVNIVVDPKVEETVSISLDAVDWRKALELIARETECTIIEETPRLIRFTQPPQISIEFQDADLKVVLDLLAKQSGANIVISEEVTGTVSIALRDVPWREALDAIVKTAGYVTVEDRVGIAQIIRVVHPDALVKQLETRIYKLKYIRPPETYTAKISDVEKQAHSAIDGVAPSTGSLNEEEFTLLKALRKALSEDGDMDFDRKTNSLIVKDVAPRLDAMQRIIEKLDVEPALVQVEVRFVSTNSDDIFELGLKFDDPNTPVRDGIQIAARGAAPNGNLLLNNNDPDDLSFSRLLNYGGTWPFDIGNWESLGVPFEALGILDLTQTQVLLSLIDDDDNSRVIQEPRLTTLDNYPSTIFVGESVPFAVQKVSQDQNGNVTVSIDENDRSPVNVGFTLYIEPHVIAGTDTIHLNVIPKVSSLVGTTSAIQGFDRFSFTDQTGSNSAYIDLPREASQTVVTYLKVEDGHTAVIGGLHTEREFEIQSGIPLLGDIPFLGHLFKWQRQQRDVEHLMILITPRIVRSTAVADQLYERALEEAARYDYFSDKDGSDD